MVFNYIKFNPSFCNGKIHKWEKIVFLLNYLRPNNKNPNKSFKISTSNPVAVHNFKNVNNLAEITSKLLICCCA